MSAIWGSVVVSALVAGLISGAVAVWGTARSITHRSVIEERQKWRDSLRDLVPRLIDEERDGNRRHLSNEILLRLNPYKDEVLMGELEVFVSDPTPENGSKVVGAFQAALKLDWEKAKIEASLIPCWAEKRAERRVKAQIRRLRRSSP